LGDGSGDGGALNERVERWPSERSTRRALARLLFVEAPGISVELNEKLQATVTFFGIATQAYVENGVTRGFLRKDLDVEVTALLVNSMVFEGVRQLVTKEDPADLARWTKAITALMFDGVRSS